MTWLLYAAWMSLAYAAGRFIEISWQAWAVAVVVGLGPAAQLASSWLAAPIGGAAGWNAVLALYLLLSGGIGAGVALFLCLLGRAQRAGA